MFSALFRKARPEPTLEDVANYMLRTDKVTFVGRVRDLFQSLEPGQATMCLVAMEEIRTILAIAKDVAAQHPNKDVPATVDDYIRILMAEEWPKNEMQRRRMLWFLCASLAQRATSIAEPDPKLHDDVAEIWVRLAEGGKYLAALLKENVIWSDKEKFWFADVKSQRDGAQYVVWLMCPYYVKLHSKIDAFADSNGFFAL